MKLKSLANLRRFALMTAMLSAAGLAGCATTGGAPKGFADLAGASADLPLHCPDQGCSLNGDLVTASGDVVNPSNGRKYFVDYPKGYQPGDKVTVVLSLHGGGSYGNWQRNYFPIMDYKDQYNLVIITPNAPPRVWGTVDDEHLHQIVDDTFDRVGRKNIKAFWLAGHSQGGMTSRRIVCTDYFADKVDGWISLSGGRIGGNAPMSPNFAPLTRGEGGATRPAIQIPTQGQGNNNARPAAGAGGAAAAFGAEPTCDFSFIYSTGEHEVQGIPATSTWAEKYSCDVRVKRADVVDSKGGYVYDPTRQDPGSIGWGRLPGPGTAEVYEFPNCDDGRIVYDIRRLGKGHTEGYEPKITEAIVKLMTSISR